MFLTLWTFYLDSLISHPLLTKCCTSATGFLIGDSIAQLLAREPHDTMRTARFAAIGFFLHAPIADAWFTFLERVRGHGLLHLSPSEHLLGLASLKEYTITAQVLFACYRLCTRRLQQGTGNNVEDGSSCFINYTSPY